MAIIGIVLLDTAQAALFDNSPLIRIRKYYNGGNFNYVDEGIFVDTFCGVNGNKDTVAKGTRKQYTDMGNIGTQPD